jgi:hypothetical protein
MSNLRSLPFAPYAVRGILPTFTFIGPDFGLSDIIGPLYTADVDRVISVLSVYVTKENAPGFTLQIGARNHYSDGRVYAEAGRPYLQPQGTLHLAGHPEFPNGNQVGIEMPLFAGESILLQLANHGTFQAVIAIIS